MSSLESKLGRNLVLVSARCGAGGETGFGIGPDAWWVPPGSSQELTFAPFLMGNPDSYPEKVGGVISPGGDCRHQSKSRESKKGEGCGTAGSCEGLSVSMATPCSRKRRRGLGYPCWRF